MASPNESDNASQTGQDLAAPHQPPQAYSPQTGYTTIDPNTTFTPPPAPHGAPSNPQGPQHYIITNNSARDDANSDTYMSDSNLSDTSLPPTLDDLSTTNQTDYTKTYNRQRRLHDPAVPQSQKPKSNPQKPKANTEVRVDDQVASLSRHAGKLRLDRFAAGEAGRRGTEEGKGKDKSDRATNEQVLDPRTRMVLLSVINKRVVSEINGCVSTGKEANVYHATVDIDEKDAEGNVVGRRTEQRAIKVFKTSILVFKDREKYVTGEFRYRSGYNKSSNRGRVRMWADKEFRNLSRLYDAGLPVPRAYKCKDNVIVMDFFGDRQGWSAPLLKDVEFEDKDPVSRWEKLYRQVCAYMRIMYQKCRLVHADLSEYNMLFAEGKLRIIDVGQGVEHDHPRSLQFLREDIKNVTAFFQRKSVASLTEPTLFGFIRSDKVALDMSTMLDELDRLSKLPQVDSTDATLQADDEVDTAVFRQQFLPQTLNQVVDYERDAGKIEKGETDDLVYRESLLAADRPKAVDDHEEDEVSSSGGSSVDGEVADRDLADRARDEYGHRRHLKRFEDKDVKKEHKQQVKEEKREKRQHKMPKKEKRAAMKSTTHRKR